MAPPFEIRPIPTQHDLLGRSLRTRHRSWEAHAARVRARELIREYLPGLFDDPPRTDRFESVLPALLEALEREFPEFHRYRAARNFLSRGIDRGNAEGLWRLDLPPVLIRVSREDQLRKEPWFRTASAVARWLNEFDASLVDLTRDPFAERPELILGVVLLSAMACGGLCEPDSVMAILPALGRERPMVALGDKVWMDLSHNASGHLRNHVDGGTPMTVRRWFVDPISLGWLSLWIRVPLELRMAILDRTDRNCAWTLVREAIAAVAGDGGPRTKSLPTSLGGFARVAVHIAEATTDIELPEALLEVAIGRTRAASVPSWNWTMLVDPGRPYPVPTLDPNTWKPVAGKPLGEPSRRSAMEGAVAALERELRRVLSEPAGQGQKLTGTLASDRLLELADSQLSGSPEAALISWYIQLLQVERLKPSSVRRYHAAIGKSWLAESEELDLSDIEVGDLDDLYHRAIGRRLTPEQRAYDAGRWQQFHDFLVRRFNAPPLLLPLDGDEDVERMVRAAVIPIDLQIVIRKAIRGATVLDKVSRTALEMLVVMAYRTGMRLGELLKVRLIDIEPSAERWLFVRPNRYGDNKSSSARRKIPLAALLTDNELKLFEMLLSLRATDVPGPGTLLFAVPGATHLPLDPWWVSRTIARMLREASGSDAFIFHHFRHTALSLAHLVLEGSDAWANTFGGISPDHARRMRVAITGRENPGRDRYWALARLAGHSSPETTFASYLHFSDLLIGDIITKSAPALSANAWRTITGFTANRLGRIAAASMVGERTRDSAIPASAMAPAIRKALSAAILAVGPTSESAPPVDVDSPKAHADHMDLALRALPRLEKGEPLTTVAYRFGIDERRLETWQDNARAIAKISTRHGGPRHIAKERSIRCRSEVLLPGRPRSHAEKREAAELVSGLRKVYRSRRDDLIWAIGYVLVNSDMSHSGIGFRSAAELDRFLSLFDGLLERRRWVATGRLPLRDDEPEGRKWLGVLNKITVAEHPDQRHLGRTHLITLRLRHPNETDILHRHRAAPTGYSATTLRFVFHMLGILLGVDWDAYHILQFEADGGGRRTVHSPAAAKRRRGVVGVQADDEGSFPEGSSPPLTRKRSKADPSRRVRLGTKRE